MSIYEEVDSSVVFIVILDLVTCDVYYQLIVCSICVKEPRLVRYFSVSELSTDKHAMTIFDVVFGCYTAGSHLNEIMTLKITLKICLTLKKYRNHTDKYLQRKPHWYTEICSFVIQGHCNHTENYKSLKTFQLYSFLLFSGFSALH